MKRWTKIGLGFGAVSTLLVYAYVSYLEHVLFKEETGRIVEFNKIERTEEELARLKIRIGNVITTVHLPGHRSERSDVRVERQHRRRGASGDHERIFPKEFYAGTMYAIPLDTHDLARTVEGISETTATVEDLRRAAVDKLNADEIFDATFSHPDSPTAWRGIVVQYRHDPGRHNHNEENEWLVLWVCRLFGQHYAYKWQAHVWGQPHGGNVYDSNDPGTFKHSTMMETVLPATHKWRFLRSELPVVVVKSKNRPPPL